MLKATQNWLEQVDYDLETAKHMLDTGRYVCRVLWGEVATE